MGFLVTRYPNGVTNVAEDNALADMPQLDPTRVITLFDDFLYPASATASDVTAWTSNSDGSTGTNAFQDATGGVYNVVTAAADNEYQAMSSVNETFKFTAGKKAWFKARVKVAEATTNDSAWWVGVTDTLTTGGLQANTAGPLDSYDGALFWKTPEDAMTINFETSNAATQNTLSTFATSITDTWTTVAFYFDGVDKIYPFAAVNNSNDLVAYTGQSITVTGLEEMHVVYGVKAGPGGAAETLQIDYIMMAQER